MRKHVRMSCRALCSSNVCSPSWTRPTPPLVVGQIKAALRAPAAHLEWTIQPLLDHLRSRLDETNYQFLKALAEALNDAEAMPHLDEYPLWRDAPAAVSD